MKSLKVIVLILLLGFSGFLFSQNTTCANASPFCTGQTMNFPAGVNAGPAQTGPFYGCLGSQPNPAWFFMQIGNTGSMSIAMSANNDIDFICWGPFPNLSTACNSLTSSNVQSCSYSGSATETCTIANAIAGQFYIMLITNFSNQVQNITFNQNNIGNPGAATTNCGFVCVVTATNSGLICAGQSATISLGAGTSTAVNSYTWSGPSSFSSTFSTSVFSNVQANSTYTVIGTSSAVINGSPYSGTCQAVTTISVVQYPSFSVTPTSTSICQGGSFFANVTFTPPNTSNPNNFTYSWVSPSGGLIWQPFGNTTLISPPLLPTTVTLATLVYSVTVAPATTLISCPITKTLAVTINNPLTPTINVIPPLCNTFNPMQLTAAPGGGTWSANPAVSASGMFTPASATIGISNVSYAVSVGTCIVANTQTVAVSRFYSPALTTSVSTLCVQDPLFNLMTIPQFTLTGSWSGPQVNSTNQFNPSSLATGNYSLTYNTTSLPDPTVCPASTVLVVPVFNPPTPTINPILPRCSNSATIALIASPGNGLWSLASGVSPAGIQTPSLNTFGTNTVLYTSGLGTCVASSSATFHTSQFISAVLTGTVGHLCVNNNPINLMGIVQNTTGSWSGLNVNNSAFTPAGLPTAIYTLTYNTQSFPNAALCPDVRTINISVLNPPTPAITKAGPFCTADSPVQLSVTPTSGYWVSSAYISSSGVFSPATSPVGNNAVHYVIGTTTCNAKQTLQISTEAFVNAAITSSIADLCTTSGQVDLKPVTLSNTGIWTGPGISGSLFNPALTGSGTFTITHNTSSIPSGLCPDKAILGINVFSLALPSITKAGPFCTNSLPEQLQVSPLGGVFSSGITGIISTAGVFNPAMGNIGDNIISYSISSGPCLANAQTSILVEKFVSADFDKYAETAYCTNNSPFNLYSLVQNPIGTFSGDSPGINGNMFEPLNANIGDNLITYETTSSPLGICKHKSSILIKVKKIPSVSVTSNSYKGCAPLQVVLNSTATTSGFGSWNLNDGSNAQEGQSLKYTFASPGSYSVVYTYKDNEAKGCSAQVVLKAIDVTESPKANFSSWPEEVTIANPEVTFSNYSTTFQNARYIWYIEGLGKRYEINPTVYFPQIGNYEVTLVATIGDCKDEMTRAIEVKNDFSVYIPNSFSPNYDGLNDLFIPVFSMFGLDTKNYKLEIFNRWGQEIFNTNDFSKGWDGTIQNKGDDPLKEDTYIYKLKYRDLEGRSYSKIGNVTLLK